MIIGALILRASYASVWNRQKKGPTALMLLGADLMDGTPIDDYLSHTVPGVRLSSRSSRRVIPVRTKVHALQVEFPEDLLVRYPEVEA